MDRAGKAIAQWSKERPDLDVSPMAVLGRLSEAASLVSHDRLAPLFARFGLRHGEFDVLATLRRSGPPFRLTPTALRHAVLLTSGGMTACLNRLETKGLITRDPSPEDRRVMAATLTPAGRDLADRAIRLRFAEATQAVAALTTQEQAVLAGLLRKFGLSLEQPGP